MRYALENFLKNEIADNYEITWRYDHPTKSIIVEVKDGLLKKSEVIGMEAMHGIDPKYLEFAMVKILRNLVREIEVYREDERKRLGDN